MNDKDKNPSISLLKEDNGNYSSMRLLSVLTTLIGLIIGIYLTATDSLTLYGVELSLGLVGFGIAGKTVSKKLEK